MFVGGRGVFVAAGGFVACGACVFAGGGGPPLEDAVFVGDGVSVGGSIVFLLVGDGEGVDLKVGINSGVSTGEELSTVPSPPDSVVSSAAVAGAPGTTVSPSGATTGMVAPSGV